MDAKVSIKTKTKTMPVQNFFRYISFKSKQKSDKMCAESATTPLEYTEESGGCFRTSTVWAIITYITFTLVRMTEQISLSIYFSTVQPNSNVCSTENLTMRSSDTLRTALGKVFWETDVKICLAVLSFCRTM